MNRVSKNCKLNWRTLILYGLLLCVAFTGPGHTEPLPPFTANYKVLRNGLTIGKSRVTLELRKDGEFLYESLTRAAGILAWVFQKDRIREYSRWEFHNNRIRPLEYRYENTGKGEERTEHLIFDWNSSVIRQTNRQPTWEIHATENALDKATMNLALMLDLQQQKKDLTYTIADDAKYRHYRFHIIDREWITVPAGRFETVKLERIRDNKRRSTFFWCAPELH
ncbi:MAG: DUF3108 domain-containing protein, partial [Gammaproteobacteria bacterium]